MLAAPVFEGTAVGFGVSGVRFLTLGDSSVDSVQSLVPAVLEELVGAPGGLAALLVDVVGGGGHVGVGLAPGGHGLVEAVFGALLGPFGDIRGAVEGGYAVVVGQPLLAGEPADEG